MRRVLRSRRALAALAGPPAASAGLLALLAAWSPGRPLPILDERGAPVPGSLSEKLRVRINGVDQGLFVTSRDPRNPVLLFVHGGPGMPTYWLTERYPTGLERRFTVAWWEQRGAAMSFEAHPAPGTMTIEQFVDDTLAVAEHLCGRFGVDRVWLMGHSWGSYVALQAAARDPHRFHAYIGVAQVTHQLESERRSWAYLVDHYRALGDERMVRRLEAAHPGDAVPLSRAWDRIRDEAMHRAGVGTTRDMRSVVTGLFLPSWRFRGYTLREKVDLWRGKVASRRSGLWDRMQATDLPAAVPELAVPAYFLHGIHDHTVSYPMAKAYASKLRAPLVGFYSFPDAAHSPMLEDPDRTLRILAEDVLRGRRSLADPA